MFEYGPDRIQAIVISLKPGLFEKADGLVGVYQDVATESSGSLTLDLKPFAAPADAASAGASSRASSASRA